MRSLRIVLGCIAAILVPQVSQAQLWVPTASFAESLPSPAIESAKAWLASIHDGDIDQGWSGSSAYFQSHVSKAQLAATAEQFRYNFGQVIYRTVLHGEQRTALPDAPAGHYAVLHFRTEGSRHGALETVTMVMHDGTWQVAGYYASGGNGRLSVAGVGALPMHWN